MYHGHSVLMYMAHNIAFYVLLCKNCYACIPFIAVQAFAVHLRASHVSYLSQIQLACMQSTGVTRGGSMHLVLSRWTQIASLQRIGDTNSQSWASNLCVSVHCITHAFAVSYSIRYFAILPGCVMAWHIWALHWNALAMLFV